jgi:hypothetical protein
MRWISSSLALEDLAGMVRSGAGASGWQSTSTDVMLVDSAHRPDGEQAPVIQTAYAYNYLPPADSPNRKLERRLRIHTSRYRVGNNCSTLYATADPNTTMLLLTHKLLRAALDDGIQEARLNLQDWLTILCCRYRENSKQPTAQPQQPPQAQQLQQPPQQPPPPSTSTATLSELEFPRHPNLASLPQMVFALMKTELLHSSPNADRWTTMHCLFGYAAHKAMLNCIAASNLTNVSCCHTQWIGCSAVAQGIVRFNGGVWRV